MRWKASEMTSQSQTYLSKTDTETQKYYKNQDSY